MSHFAVKLTLALAIGSVLWQAAHAQETKPRATSQQFSETKLIDRFNKILEEELESKNVSLSFKAGRLLDNLVRHGAEQIVQEKAFDALPEADANFRKLTRHYCRSRGTE